MSGLTAGFEEPVKIFLVLVAQFEITGVLLDGVVAEIAIGFDRERGVEELSVKRSFTLGAGFVTDLSPGCPARTQPN